MSDGDDEENNNNNDAPEKANVTGAGNRLFEPKGSAAAFPSPFAATRRCGYACIRVPVSVAGPVSSKRTQVGRRQQLPSWPRSRCALLRDRVPGGL